MTNGAITLRVAQHDLLRQFGEVVENRDGWYAEDYLRIQDRLGGLWNPTYAASLKDALDTRPILKHVSEWNAVIDYFWGTGSSGWDPTSGDPAPAGMPGTGTSPLASIAKGILISVAAGLVISTIKGD
jgi:hypothetical protein